MGDQHITSNSAKRRMILQEREAQSCDARCIYHPQDMNCDLKQHVEVFLGKAERARRRIRKIPFVKVLLGWKSVI